MAKSSDPLKEKFRPDDAALNKEIDDALAGVSLDALYGFDKPAPAHGSASASRPGDGRHASTRSSRRGTTPASPRSPAPTSATRNG